VLYDLGWDGDGDGDYPVALAGWHLFAKAS
jgi:hypothetical protein